MTIRLLKKGEEERWDAFVCAHPFGDYTQLSGYGQVVEGTYGHKTQYFLLEESGAWRSIFVLTTFRDFLQRTCFISHAGALMDPGISEDEAMAVAKLWFQHVENLLVDEGTRGAVALYQRDRAEAFSVSPHQSREVAVLSLARPWADIEAGFERQIGKAVRKAREEGIVVERMESKKDLLEHFFLLYKRWSKERHGAPAHGSRYFEALHDALSKHILLYVARANEEVVAALLGFDTGKRVYAAWSPSITSARQNRANDLLHFTMIRDAQVRGIQTFDFGPVRYGGQERYKEKWGTERIPAPLWYVGVNPGVAAHGRNSVVARVWRALPAPLTDRLGPWVRKHIGQ